MVSATSQIAAQRCAIREILGRMRKRSYRRDVVHAACYQVPCSAAESSMVENALMILFSGCPAVLLLYHSDGIQRGL